MTYAADTKVSAERTRAQIEQLVVRYGAGEFATGWRDGAAMIGFTMNERHVRFVLPLPRRDDDEFTRTPTGKARAATAAGAAWEQACRSRWRALHLAIKAKLEAVEVGIVHFDDEFMSHIVLPGGQSVGEFMRPQIERSYQTGDLPKLLPHLQ